MGCKGSKEAVKSADKYRVDGGGPSTEKDAAVANTYKKGAASPAKKKDSPAAAAAKAANTGGIANYSGPKARLDPKNFEFVGLKGETRVKLPGSINGQAFNIDNCQDCTFYLLDTCAQVTIDDCTNCRIFVGPTEASIFIRTSKHCKCAFVCRQLRTRDCNDVQVSLFCRTRPIIESSVEMSFACYDWEYPQLAGQMKSIKLHPLLNYWSHCFDYTPASAAVGGANFRLLPPSTTAASLLGPPPPEVEELVASGASEAQAPQLLATWGARPPPHAGYLFVLFGPKRAEDALAFAANLHDCEATLLYSNMAPIDAENVTSLVENAGWKAGSEKSLLSGVATGFEFSGTDDALSAVLAAANSMGALCTTAEIGGGFRYLGIE